MHLLLHYEKSLLKKSEWKNISTSSKGNGRALFLVHREQIAKQALRSYRKIFGRTKSLGLISGNVSEKDKIENLKADIVFVTIQTMTKPEYFKQYDALDFSVIVLDESHNTAGDSYQRIEGQHLLDTGYNKYRKGKK